MKYRQGCHEYGSPDIWTLKNAGLQLVFGNGDCRFRGKGERVEAFGAGTAGQVNEVLGIAGIKVIKRDFGSVLENRNLKISVGIKIRKENCTVVKNLYFRISGPVNLPDGGKIKGFAFGGCKNIKKGL